LQSKEPSKVGSVTSVERGTLVTIVFAVEAFEKAVRPFYIFSRKMFKDYFLIGGPSGCMGAAN
jgi:hypothetical protein